MALWSSDPDNMLPVLLHLLLVLTVAGMLLFFFRSRNSPLWPDSAKHHALYLQGILFMSMAVFLFSTVVSPYRYLMPLRQFTHHVEQYLAQNPAPGSLPASWNNYALYNAIECLVMCVGVLVAYWRTLKYSYVCMDAIGGVLLQQRKEKDTENHVTFEMDETPLQPRPRVAMRKTHQVMLALALFVASVAFLPACFRHTFAYTVVDSDPLVITSDHVLATAIGFFTIKMARGVHYNMCNVPQGFLKGMFAACQFSLIYGTLLAVASMLFLSLVNDVMFTYIYKVFALYHRRESAPEAMASDVVIPDANYFTCSFANYLVDSTYATIESGMSPEELLSVLRLLVLSYKNMYIDLFQLLAFGCTVFVPMMVGSLVLFNLAL